MKLGKNKKTELIQSMFKKKKKSKYYYALETPQGNPHLFEEYWNG